MQQGTSLAGTVEGGLSRPMPHSCPSLHHCPLEPQPSSGPCKHAWHWAFSREQMPCMRVTEPQGRLSLQRAWHTGHRLESGLEVRHLLR